MGGQTGGRTDGCLTVVVWLQRGGLQLEERLKQQEEEAGDAHGLHTGTRVT